MFTPRPIRKLFYLFRGQISPVMIVLSVGLGFWFGLTPGWSGLHTAMVLAFFILNINLGTFLLASILGKAVCYGAAPALYHCGMWVMEHQPVVIKVVAGIPIVGITDFSRYAVVGALVAGPVMGLVLGLLLASVVVRFRRLWLKLEEGSETFQVWQSKKWVRFLAWLLVGGTVKKVRGTLETRGKIVRKGGIGVAIFLVIVLAILMKVFGNEWITGTVQEQLSQLNEAEVNVDAIKLDFLGGSVAVTGLQMTDPEKLTHNKIAVGELSSKIGLWDLSLGRVVLEEVKLAEILFDQPRAVAGKKYQKKKSDKEETFDPGKLGDQVADSDDLDSYLKKGEELTDFLGKLNEWLPKEKTDPSEKGVKEDKPETYLAHLQARASTPPTPKVVVEKIILDEIRVPVDLVGLSSLEIDNASDAPEVAGKPLVIRAKSLENFIRLKITGHYESPELGTEITGEFSGIDLHELQKQLSDENRVIFQRGTVKGTLAGVIKGGLIHATIEAQTQDMYASTQRDTGLFGLDEKTTRRAMEVMNRLEAKLEIVGPIEKPKLVFDAKAITKQLEQSLVDIGTDLLKEKADKQIEKALGDLLGIKKKDRNKETPVNGDAEKPVETETQEPNSIEEDTVTPAEEPVLTEKEKRKKRRAEKRRKKKEREREAVEIGIGILNDLLGSDKEK